MLWGWIQFVQYFFKVHKYFKNKFHERWKDYNPQVDEIYSTVVVPKEVIGKDDNRPDNRLTLDHIDFNNKKFKTNNQWSLTFFNLVINQFLIYEFRLDEPKNNNNLNVIVNYNNIVPDGSYGRDYIKPPYHAFT